MIDVMTSIEILRPPGEVFQYACDPDKAPEWYVNIRSAKRLLGSKDGVPEAGSRIAFTARFLGKDLSYTYEVIKCTANEFVMRTAEGPFPMETTYYFESTDGHTKMSLRNRGEPKGFSAFFAPFMALMMRRANTKDLRKLKSILESRF
jgi:hypothetical protein